MSQWHGALYVWTQAGRRVTMTLVPPTGRVDETAPIPERHLGRHRHAGDFIYTGSHDGACSGSRRRGDAVRQSPAGMGADGGAGAHQ